MRHRRGKGAAQRRKDKSASPPRRNTVVHELKSGGDDLISHHSGPSSSDESDDESNDAQGADGSVVWQHKKQSGASGTDSDTADFDDLGLFLVLFVILSILFLTAFWFWSVNNAPQQNVAGRRYRHQVQESQYTLHVSLLDAYSGAAKIVRHERQAVCPVCTGRKLSAAECPDCAGRHVHVHAQRDFFSGRVHRQCFCTYDVDLTVEVPPGSTSGDVLRLEGEGNRHPNANPGDVVLTLLESEHSRFERFEKVHLKTKIKITLREALLGFDKEIQHLSRKRTVKVRQPPGRTTQHGEFVVVRGEGMPFKEKGWQSSIVYGNLYVEVAIVFPQGTRLAPEIRRQFEELFPP